MAHQCRKTTSKRCVTPSKPWSIQAGCSFQQPRRKADRDDLGGPISFRSPWQNGYLERLIGSVRHECTDHLIVFSEEHLRRILGKYSAYYNEVRSHVSLGKEAPCTRPIERFADIIAYPILGGLQHRYAGI